MSHASEKLVAILHNPDNVLHSTRVKGFQENPERLRTIIGYFKMERVFDDRHALITEFEDASPEDALRVHDADYIEFVKNYCKRGGGILGGNTYFTKDTYKIALEAAGGTIEACRLVHEGKFSASFALVRPPGHHASRNRFGGYCIFNNAAIAARYLISKHRLERVMILDWDAHAADGTMSIFYEDPSVLTFSIHSDPSSIYPRDGFAHQVGRGKGRGYTVNVEMPDGSGDEDYRRVMEEIFVPVYEKFRPKFIIACCGFDAHWSDSATGLRLTVVGFHDIVRSVRERGAPMAAVLEGGYSKANGKLAHAVVRALSGEGSKYREDIQKPDVSKKLDKKLAHLKSVLSEFYKF